MIGDTLYDRFGVYKFQNCFTTSHHLLSVIVSPCSITFSTTWVDTSQRSASITDNYNTIPSNPQEPPLPPNNSTNIVTINSDDSSSDSESSIDDDGEDRMDHEDPRQNKER